MAQEEGFAEYGQKLMLVIAAKPGTPFFVNILRHGNGQRIDAIKMIALVCMIGDHVNTILFHREIAWLYLLGRVAFPLFAIVYGFNLGTDRSRLKKSAKRAFLYGAICQPIYWLAFAGQEFAPWYGLNIIFSFGAAGLVLLLWQSNTAASKVGAAAVLAAFSVLLAPGSYGLAGLVFILASNYCATHAGTKAGLAGLAVWWFALLAIHHQHPVLMVLASFIVWCAINLCVLLDYIEAFRGRFMPSMGSAHETDKIAR